MRLVDVEDAEVVGHLKEAPEMVFADDAPRRPGRARALIAVAPPRLRHAPEPFGLVVSDERLIRPVGDGVIERTQMRTHLVEQARLARELTGGLGAVAEEAGGVRDDAGDAGGGGPRR